jgi:hypothetical protein
MMDDAEHSGDQAGEEPGQGGGDSGHQYASDGQCQRVRENLIEGPVGGQNRNPVLDDGNSEQDRMAEFIAVPVDWHGGQGIGDPAGQEGDGEVDPQKYGRNGRDDHVEGDRRGKPDKNAQAQAATEGALVEIPKLARDAVGADQPAQHPMGAMLMVIQLIVKMASKTHNDKF